MNSAEVANVKRVIQMLGYQGKLHLSRQEIAKLVEELTLNRDYELADYVRGMDPAAIAQLLR